MRQAVILAGGLGKRVNHITGNKIPKSLIEIEGIPFLSYQLSLLKNCNFDEAVICIGYLGNLIKNKYGNDYRGLKITYSEDPFEDCGTGCALKSAESLLQNRFLLMCGDVYIPIRLDKLFDRFADTLYTMIVVKNINDYELSNVTIEYGFSVYTKYLVLGNAEYLDSGVNFIAKDCLKLFVPNTQSDLSDCMEVISQYRMMSSCIVDTRTYEIGSEEGISRFTNYIKELKCKL